METMLWKWSIRKLFVHFFLDFCRNLHKVRIQSKQRLESVDKSFHSFRDGHSDYDFRANQWHCPMGRVAGKAHHLSFNILVLACAFNTLAASFFNFIAIPNTVPTTMVATKVLIFFVSLLLLSHFHTKSVVVLWHPHATS